MRRLSPELGVRSLASDGRGGSAPRTLRGFAVLVALLVLIACAPSSARGGGQAVPYGQPPAPAVGEQTVATATAATPAVGGERVFTTVPATATRSVAPATAVATVAAPSGQPAPPGPTPAAGPPRDTGRISGTILDVATSARVFTLRTETSALTVAIDTTTVIRFASGGPATFQDLQPQVQVEVTGQPGVSGVLAREVVILGR